MTRFEIEHLGPIAEARVDVADLTVLTGPQASGKSVWLQVFKLWKDCGRIRQMLKQYAFAWDGTEDFSELYFGEGMRHLWNSSSCVRGNGQPFVISPSCDEGKSSKNDAVFYIPAQRVLAVQRGWPAPFMDFGAEVPFVVKNFSEQLRRLLELGKLGEEGTRLFPVEGKLKKPLRDLISAHVYYGASVRVDKRALKKRLVLEMKESLLPVMAWSSGQREFLPLLLGLLWLMPSSRGSRKSGVEYVVIEEPEMGLHPRALLGLLLAVLELIRRGYKVLLSTHSVDVLQWVWALRAIQESGDAKKFYRLFDDLQPSRPLDCLFEQMLTKKTTTWYFDKQSAAPSVVRDISALDPFSDREEEKDWGGLLSFTTRVTEVVADIYASLAEKSDCE